ncbi:MAG: hypothetical protein IJE40_02835 [Clostridia bacterium]|nr:hypothetical protein [Clostridia bacterium]
MKKIICLTISIIVFFSFSAETSALGYCRALPSSYTTLKETSPANKNIINKEYYVVPIRLTQIKKNSEKQESQLVYSKTSNVTVIDSKQVKVKYDFWIVKFFKKLFEID